jgi:hypothetical protein
MVFLPHFGNQICWYLNVQLWIQPFVCNHCWKVKFELVSDSNGLNQSVACMGNSLALFLTIPLATLFTWRAPLTIYGAIFLGLTLAWLLLGKERQ